MILSDFLTEIRQDFLDDSVLENLWSDAQLLRFIKEAINELCVRASVLNKSSRVFVKAGIAQYDIEPTIRQIYTAKLNLSDRALIQTTLPELELTRGISWRTRTGTPTHYVRKRHVIILFPVPTVADTLIVWSSNLTDSDDVADDLELIDEAYHKCLMYYIAYKALLLNDADAGQQKKALDYFAMFENIAGARHTAKHDQFKFETPIYGSSVPFRMC